METKEILDNFEKLLHKYKYKKYDIERHEEGIDFTRKDIIYSVLVEDETIVHYGIRGVEGYDISFDFYNSMDDIFDYEYFEDFLISINENFYTSIKTCLDDLDKLQRKYNDGDYSKMNDDLFRKLICEYFGLFE